MAQFKGVGHFNDHRRLPGTRNQVGKRAAIAGTKCLLHKNLGATGKGTAQEALLHLCQRCIWHPPNRGVFGYSLLLRQGAIHQCYPQSVGWMVG